MQEENRKNEHGSIIHRSPAGGNNERADMRIFSDWIAFQNHRQCTTEGLNGNQQIEKFEAAFSIS